jgi:hypothetical protein
LCWRQGTEKANDHGMVPRKNSAPRQVLTGTVYCHLISRQTRESN